MPRVFSALLVLILAVPAFAADRIAYDKQCLTIDGKDTFIFSGAFHYFRCPKELWRDRFAKMKLAGCNAVETYVAWNWHEKEKPASLDDFSKVDMGDLDEWLRIAEEEFGFYTIVRPGPYICAEWDNGGYPRWLLPLKPEKFEGTMWLRGADPTYLAWCKHYFTAVAKVVVPHQITRRPAGKPGVILWQIENEYNYANQPHDVKRAQIMALAKDSRELGIDVPLFTCVTSDANFSRDPFINANVIETVNSYPGFNMNNHRGAIERVARYQPDKFLMITEQQGGWFSQVGGRLSTDHGFNAAQINMITMVSLAQGLTAINYYMFFGGTNFGDTGGHRITTTYDYDAPIREWGGVDERFAAVQAIGLMLQEHGPKLARAVADPCEVLDSVHDDVRFIVRRAADGARYVFVSTEQRDAARKGNAKLRFSNGDETVVEYSLDPYGAKILYMPTDAPPSWLPKPSLAIDRPTDLPAAVKIADVLRKDDPGPTNWKPIQAGKTLEELGIYDSRNVFYRGKFTKADQPIPDAGLSVSPKMSSQDAAIASIGGKIVSRENNFIPLIRFDRAQIETGVEVTVLHENTGHSNGGPGMEDRRGIESWLTSIGGANKAISDWRMKRTSGDGSVDTGDDLDDSSWEKVAVDQGDGEMRPNTRAVYRATVEISEDQLKDKQTILRFGRIDDAGVVYVNGKKVGEANDWAVPHTFDVAQQLRAGKNTIAVVVRNNDGVGGLAQNVTLEPAVERSWLNSTWEISDAPAGVSGKWWSVGLDDGAWEKTSLTPASAPSEPKSLLTWYRVKFELPEARSGVWVPWKIRLEASGNGLVYLNDRALGRYWQVGPQRDYYLPECWLKFGKGQTNVLTLCLRPTKQGTALNNAEVAPYSAWAEKR